MALDTQVHPGRTLTIFGLLSAIVEALNANPTTPKKAAKLCHIIMKTSQILQLLVISCCCALGWTSQEYLVRVRSVAARGNSRAPVLLATLDASMLVGFVPCVYRMDDHFRFSNLGGRDVECDALYCFGFRSVWIVCKERGETDKYGLEGKQEVHGDGHGFVSRDG
ncbi:hypothetical protein AJ78_04144 [Emergomyces pasteurianus Ep9510]|uniref:Uncharacterized protein n=1 Tax=Emergomyces pasteurianus Ep9510 TaxID=1447872 RepID=A0A1J9PGS4_9EURO|nr:hypothetical protein AJ78_04144 [Emergomyces pasteurianus Ep9510]